MNDKLDLSIIVPVYNVEKYIRHCMESIFKQGLDEDSFEVIIVNDGTPDHSMEVIQDIIVQHKNIRVINQENQGLSVARNNGIAVAKGEYIMMPDSDDMLFDKSLSILLDHTINTKADLIVADFIRMTSEDIANKKFPNQKAFKLQEKSGKELFIEDYNPFESYVWRTLYRRQFLIENRIMSYSSIEFEDLPFTHECYLKAQKCIRVSWFLYIYRIGHVSVTSLLNKKKAKNFCLAISETWKLVHWPGHTPETLQKLKNDVFTNFTFLTSWVSYSFKDSTDRLDIINYIRQLAPDMTFKDGIKQRLISFFLRKMPHLFMDWNYYGRRLKHLVK